MRHRLSYSRFFMPTYSQVSNLNRKEIKMPAINIDKGKDATVMTRGAVMPGQVFAVKGRDGKLGTNFGHIGTCGRTGRMYSVNLKTGELSSSTKATSSVVLTGTYQYTINRNPAPSVVRDCRRSDVRSGEAFHVKGKDVLYAHLGRITLDAEGFLSVPLARTENHAVTRNGNSNVSVVATFTIDANLVA
jgi:hypothetical protein